MHSPLALQPGPFTAAVLARWPVGDVDVDGAGLFTPSPHRVEPGAAGGAGCALPLARLEAVLAGQAFEHLLPAALRRSVRKRQIAFLGGRLCAERSLRRLGVDAPEVHQAADGRPLWPCGTEGSISHTEHSAYAVALHAGQCISLGIDSELVDPSANAAIAELCCTRHERVRWLAGRLDAVTPTLIFSAKEAYYKAVHRMTERFMNFGEVEVVALDRRSAELLLAPTPGGEFAASLPSARVCYRIEVGPPTSVHTALVMARDAVQAPARSVA